MRKHGYTGLRAREFAVRAVPSSISRHMNVAQYEDISDDDTVFDLINEIEIIRSYDEKIVDFDIEYLKDDTLEHGSKETKTSEVDVNGGLSANGDKDFLNGDVDVSINADDGADLMFDAGDSGNVVVRDDGDVDDSINAEDGADLMFDAGDSGNVVVRDDGDVDHSINADDGADLMFDAGDSGNFVAGDDGDVDSESEGDDSVFIIDSEDDLALEISTSITRRQTFTFTVRKETTYIAGQEVTTNTYKERDYQEDWY